MPPHRLPANSPIGTFILRLLVIISLCSTPLTVVSQADEATPIQVKQGDIAYLTLKLEPEVQSVRGKFLNESIPFFKKGEGEFAAIIGIDLAQAVGPQPLSVTWKKGGSIGTEKYLLHIVPASFGTEKLTLPKKMVDLDPPTLARVEREKQQMLTLFDTSAGQRLWEGDFVVPTEGKIRGSFGQSRIMNGQPRNPHTGEDISAPLGAPVLASNGGKVIMVGDYYFNGNSIVIDHGLGLFSMYFHLSKIAVKEGDQVVKGQTIGSVGQSGRATGPHLHWGMRLNGARVNPFSLVEKKLG
ncbi:MAG: M23 family metallopeptidase [Nitrospirae bacterium]|nr:M23 family metallopeptidase [Candidatus Manganitrophaceae bacterium]